MRLLQARIQLLVGQVRDDGLGDRDFCRADRHALMSGGQEGAAVVLHAAVTPRRRDRDEGRQVLALAAQSIADPGPDTGPHEVRLTGVQSQQRLAMCRALGVQRADHAQLVGVPGQLRKQLADPDAAFAVLGELKRRTEQRAEVLALAADVFTQQRLAIVGVEPRLRIEEVDMTGPAPHEQKDDPLGTGNEVR